jgi:NADH:ubiquinone oxidoreductase subunit 4 (subunit M)
VEAPTYGSVVLARVLLKLGGIGLLRIQYLFCWSSLLFKIFLSFFLVCLVLTTVVCCFQSDFKRLIAYSSIAHMLVVPIMVLCGTLLSFKSSILVMFYHGVRSSLLFMMVGVMYSMLGTRQLLLIRGLISLSPLISFLIVISFLYTVSAPPFPSFYAEFLTVLSSFQLSYLYVIFFIIYLFIVMLYNLN